MRFVPIALLLSMSSAVWAADVETTTATTVQNDDIRVLGRLNANLATREELLALPFMDAAAVDRVIDARSHGALTTLLHLELSDEARARLVLNGPSTLRRIRQLPLEVFSMPAVAATR